MTDTQNGRTTLALVGQKLDALDAKFTEHTSKVDVAQNEYHKLDRRVVRLEERLAVYAVGMMAFSVLASAIAAYIGTLVQ